MFFDEAIMDPATTIIAIRDGRPIGSTATDVKENGVAYTHFTGVAREERGKGIALLLKLRAIRELKRMEIKLYGTTNDEANAAMRGINRRLGYTPEPATIMVEKRLT
jgi:RimJ/RimL family protein N-acetyltransferase